MYASSSKSEHRSLTSALLDSRGFLMFLVLFSCWSLYRGVRHASSRFHVPHSFVMKHAFYGQAGWAIDLICYISVGLLLIGMVRSTRDTVEVVLFVGWVGPVVINPLKMLVPGHASIVWWVELGMGLVFFLASATVLVRLLRRTPDKKQLDMEHADFGA